MLPGQGELTTDMEKTLHISHSTHHACLVVAFFSDILKERVVNINNYITFSLYSNVCRSLFEQHKLMFAFLVCVRILMNDGQIDMVSRTPWPFDGIPSGQLKPSCSALQNSEPG